MTDLDLTKLRALAAAATPGPWRKSNGGTGVVDAESWWVCKVNRITPVDDAAFIAALNPATALALVERVEGLERELAWSADIQRAALERHEAVTLELKDARADRDAYRAMLADLVAGRNRYDDDEIMVDMFRRARELLKHGPNAKGANNE